jgi:hypothetical protein
VPRNPLSIFNITTTLAFIATATAAERVSFNRDVRPILSNCFSCHGPDEKKREAELRLDDRVSALKEREGFRAIVPGKPDESELLTRVLSQDKEEMMPPPKSKKPRLSEAQANVLRRWIEQGAEYEGHWAFLPLRNESLPKVRDASRTRNPIDSFILSRLEKEGLSPSPEADRATLIRRAYLDLIGLLPSPEEVRAFIEDPAPDAYERIVDRLLANPHHGERWGRHWLDQARYADSNGYSIDSARAMWPFRDWVIAALNNDLPFDQFTIEQLAGDLLPNPTKSQLVATAFHRNTLINEEGGTDKEQFRNEAVIDRVNTTGAVWLGLTIGCAQCHTHKFDPISQREYYEFFAFFNQGTDINNKGETLSVARGEMFGESAAPPPPSPRMTLEEWERKALAGRDEATSTAVSWFPAKYLEYDTVSNASFRLLPDNSLLSDGRGSFNDTYRVVAQTNLRKITAIRLRVLTDDSLPRRGPGLATNGNFVLTNLEVKVGGDAVRFAHAFADQEQPNFPVSAAIDEQPRTGWAINVGQGGGKLNANHEAVFVLADPLVIEDQTIEFQLHHDLNQNYLIGRFAIDFAETAPAGPGIDAALLTALKTPSKQRSDAEQKIVMEAYEREAPAPAEPRGKRDSADLMIMKEVAQLRPTFLHIRGDFLRNDEKTGMLTPGVLQAVAPALPPAAQRTRLDLAKWLISPDNPRTPRVTMNRVWMRYFGRGIVETEEDFGTQGSPPTHPELLDWLASEFIRRGWSLKAMHRLIVTSATYRQSSHARADIAERDPRNLLLARQERLRVEGEIVRDGALSASGLLDSTIGGPSVHPPQPEGVYAFTQTGKKWEPDTGPNRFRRGLYTQFYRSSPYPLFTTFDAPDFQNVCTRRARSNTPLQALNLANDPAFLEMAAALAKRVEREVPANDLDARLRRAFVLCLSREPSAKELAVLHTYCEAQDGGLASVARALFNTDNFITRE